MDWTTRRRPMGVVGLVLGVVAFLATSGSPAGAQTAPTLGTATSFAVLAATTVENTGSSVISGDLGVSPNNAVVGFPPGDVINGDIHAGDEVAAQAQADALTAYNNLAGQPCPPENNLTDQDLGGLTLTPGVYCFSSSAQLTGPLTLDAQGDPDAVFIFQIGTTLTTGSASSVNLIGEADPCNVFWQVGSSATLGTETEFVGTVIANQSITATTDASVVGRLLALNGAVTLDTNTVNASACDTTGTTTTVPDGTTTTVPDGTTTTTVPDGTTTTTVPDGTTTTVPDGTTTTSPGAGGGTGTDGGGTGTDGGGTGTDGEGTGTDGGGTGIDGGGTGTDGAGGHQTMPRTGSAVHAMTVTGVLAIVSGSLALLVADSRRPAAAGSSSPGGRSRDHHRRRRGPWSWPWPRWLGR